MPEIAEVARIVHFLRAHLVGKQIKKVTAVEDANVYGKVGTSGPEFEKALAGRKVVSAGNQGKYFWLVLDKPPHPVMHFGMTGWIHIKGVRTAYTNYYNKMKPGEEDQWPPKYWKFQLETDSDPKVEVAFVDPRRFGRIRLVDCPGKDIRQASPLVENGPDPVVDQDLFTYKYLLDKMRSRHVPVKALLLDQAMISGIGNWVGDEVLYHAKLHPEQYCDEFNDSQIKTLHNSICHVCRIACDKLGDSDQFPEKWLFNHRWGKGKKDAASALPNGEKLAFLTVGGRTSCYAPNVQKKTGHVAPGIKEEPITSIKEEKKPAKTKAPKNDTKIEPPSKKRRKANATPVKMEEAEHDVKKTKPKENKSQEGSGTTNRRRSARLSAA